MSSSARTNSPWIALLQEQRYRREFLDADRRQTAAVTAIITAVVTPTVRNDFLLRLDARVLWVTIALRALLVAVTVVALVGLRRARTPRRMDRVSGFALGVLAVCFCEYVLSRLSSEEFHGPVLGTIAALAVLYFARDGR